MKKVFVPVVAAVLLAAMALPAQANHSWGGYHWSRASNPVTLTVVNSLTSNWDGYASTALSDWDQSTVLSFANQQGDESSQTRRKCNPIAGKIVVCNQTYGFNGWLGIANIWLYSGTSHIAQATTKLNDSYFNSGSYNTPAWRQMVACQEIGHDFGLDHQDENFNNANLGTCMDYTNDPSTNQHPNKHDYDQLLAIYQHLDSAALAPTGPGHGNHYGTYTTETDGFTVVTFVLYA